MATDAVSISSNFRWVIATLCFCYAGFATYSASLPKNMDAAKSLNSAEWDIGACASPTRHDAE